MFTEEYGENNLWNYGQFNNCISYWSSKFEYYNEMFSPLVINEHEDFVLIKYNLLDTDSDFWERYNCLYRECRSVVIDKRRECFVLTPFRKFFNLNEKEETQEFLIKKMIENAKSIEITEKIDGSMQSARFYNGKIVLAGTSALSKDVSFRVNIGYSLIDENYEKMLMDNPDCTFIFELVCKEDAHVVVYTEEQRGLYLIGVRNSITGEQWSYSQVINIANKYGVKHTNAVNKSFDDLINELDTKRSNEAEGHVIDIDGYKIKLKYNDYVLIHRMISKMLSSNAIIKSVDNGTWDDVKSKIPDAYRSDAELIANDVIEFVKMMTNKIDDMFLKCKNEYEKFENPVADRKSFAIHAIETCGPLASYLINIYIGGKNNFIKNKAGRYLRYYEIKQYLAKGGF